MKKIGIKLADGAFFPILKEGQPDKKKVNLTTVKDNQTTVQVSLYASESSSMEDAILIDTLKINKLEKQPNGQPDINLSISIDKNNIIEATLKDESTKEQASINASLQEALLAADKNPGTGKGLLGAAEEIKLKDEAENSKVASQLDDINFDIPDFEEGPAPQAEIVPDAPVSRTKKEKREEEQTVVQDFDIPVDDVPVDDVPADEPADQSMDLPDFDMPDFNDSPSDASFESSDDSLKFSENEFDMPDFNDDMSSTKSDPFAETSSEPASSDLDFSDLYDDEDESKQNTGRGSSFKYILLALICLLILLVIFLLFRTFKNSGSNEEAKNATVVEEEILSSQRQDKKEEPLPPEPEPEPAAPSAKEDEIVVVEEAESVVPDLPKVEEKKEPKVITYKIKWGDTLWDISAAYYKNPWRYPKIARYNGIKNPNHIVAGTYIKIPEE